MTETQWTQLLLVGIPVLSLVGALMALRSWSRLTRRRVRDGAGDADE